MSKSILSQGLRIGTGRTEPGKTEWRLRDAQDPSAGIFANIDTSGAKFVNTPNYVVSLCGVSDHWELAGASMIWDATPNGFQINLRWWTNNATPLTPKTANDRGWYVTWIAIEE